MSHWEDSLTRQVDTHCIVRTCLSPPIPPPHSTTPIRRHTIPYRKGGSVGRGRSPMESGRRVGLLMRDRGMANLVGIAVGSVLGVRGGGSLGLRPIFQSIGQCMWRAWTGKACLVHELCSGGCRPPCGFTLSPPHNRRLPLGGRRLFGDGGG